MRNSSSSWLLLAVGVVVLSLIGACSSTPSTPTPVPQTGAPSAGVGQKPAGTWRFSDFAHETWAPYRIGQTNINPQDVLAMQENGLDYYNAHDAAARAVELITNGIADKDSKQLAKGKGIIDRLRATFEREHAYPRPAYKEFAQGWVSSMDAPSILIGALGLKEAEATTEYDAFIEALIQYCQLDVLEGGFMLPLRSGGRWPLEYADKLRNEQNSLFVLNGSLLGYLGIKAAALITGDERLLKLAAETEVAYGSLFGRYDLPGQNWSRYMLNPDTPNPPHYMIFERKLFVAIEPLSPHFPAFAAESKARADYLQSALTPVFNTVDGKTVFSLTRACGPHPYLIDIYGTRVEFLNDGGKVIGSAVDQVTGALKGDSEKFAQHAVISGEVPAGATGYRVVSVDTGDETVVASGAIRPTAATQRLNLSFELSGARSDGSVALDPSGTWAVLGIALERPLSSPLPGLVSLEVNSAASEIMVTKLRLRDSKGQTATRYTPQTRPGRNAILVATSGFPGIDQLADVAQIEVHFHTEKLTAPATAVLENAVLLPDARTLADYLATRQFPVNPQ